jgi:hypothetical protein
MYLRYTTFQAVRQRTGIFRIVVFLSARCIPSNQEEYVREHCYIHIYTEVIHE